MDAAERANAGSGSHMTRRGFVRNDVDISYLDAAGPTDPRWAADAIMLVHGWACGSTDWAESVERLARGIRVLAPDLRGHGDSSDAEDYSLTAMADDILALAEHLSIDRLVLIGHSAGAEIAAEAALRAPGLVVALAGSDPAFGTDPADRERLVSVANELDSADDGSAVAAAFARVPEPAGLVAAHRALALASRPRVSAAMFRSFNLGADSWHFAPDTERRLAPRTWPMWVAMRNETRACFPRGLARSDDRVIVLEGGHWPHQEHHKEFFDDLEGWLDAVASR